MHKIYDNVKENSSQKFLNELLTRLPEWRPDEFIKENMKAWKSISVLISGSSRAGKSQMLKYLLARNGANWLKYFDLVVIFSKTLVNGFYQSFIDSKLMFSDFKPEVIENLKQIYLKFKKQGRHIKTLFIFDDMVSARSKYLQEITDLYLHGRHYEMSSIFLTQKCSLLSTAWMANCTLFISLFAGSIAEKKYISEKIVSDNIDIDLNNYHKSNDIYRIGQLLQAHICQDYRALIICPYNNKRDEYLSGKVFWFKAKLIKTAKKKNNGEIPNLYEKFIEN